MPDEVDVVEYAHEWPATWSELMARHAERHRVKVVITWDSATPLVQVAPRWPAANAAERKRQSEQMREWREAAVGERLLPDGTFVSDLPAPRWWELCSDDDLRQAIADRLRDFEPDHWDVLRWRAIDGAKYKEINERLGGQDIAERTLSRAEGRLKCSSRDELYSLIRRADRAGAWPVAP